jgi:formylglycine-generating enzyme required for sulfatase activity
LTRLDQELPRAGSGPPLNDITKPGWYVNGQGQTFAVIPAPGTFEIGSRPDQKGKAGQFENLRRVQINYPFAVAMKLVTVADFKKARPNFERRLKEFSPGPDTPINAVSWFEAAGYCNWLSEQEKIPKEQWCYEPNAKGDYAEGMRIKPNYLALSGYRLPLEAEWEYACRAGTVTAWPHGSDGAFVVYYAWDNVNAMNTMHPVGALKPNGLGLFDINGNAWQWCQDSVFADGPGNQTKYRLRGGSFLNGPGSVQSEARFLYEPGLHVNNNGFRVARTIR